MTRNKSSPARIYGLIGVIEDGEFEGKFVYRIEIERPHKVIEGPSIGPFDTIEEAEEKMVVALKDFSAKLRRQMNETNPELQ